MAAKKLEKRTPNVRAKKRSTATTQSPDTDAAEGGSSAPGAFDQFADALGERRVEQMRSFLTGLVGLWEPFLPADIDAIPSLILKEHWTLARIAGDDPSPKVRELARAVDSAWKRSRDADRVVAPRTDAKWPKAEST